MQLRNGYKQLFCAVLALVLVFTGSYISCFTATAASYESQIKELEQKQAALKQKIDALQGDIDEQEGYKSALQDQIDVVQGQIDIYNGQIDKLQDKIDQMEADKSAKEQEIQDKKDTFLARIRAMYIAGNDSMLTVLLGANDFADYLYQNELLASVTEYDNKVMDQLRDEIAEINKLEKQVEAEKAEIKKIKSTVDVKRAELGKNMKALDAVISKLENQQDQLEFDVDEYQKEIERLEAKIEAAAQSAKDQANQGNIKYDGSQFLWPTPGYYYISSNYGYRWGRLHEGCDIAGSNIYGKPIVAAADGVVSLVDYNAGGYGYYVMVNHGNSGGNNYVTLYAHMSSQAAYVGKKVSKGDVIGYVGSTGRSTGPHLHFEIRVNGTAQNPLNFF